MSSIDKKPPEPKCPTNLTTILKNLHNFRELDSGDYQTYSGASEDARIWSATLLPNIDEPEASLDVIIDVAQFLGPDEPETLTISVHYVDPDGNGHWWSSNSYEGLEYGGTF